MHFTRDEESAERGTNRRPRLASIGYVSSGLEDLIQPEPQPLPREIFRVDTAQRHMASADIMVAQEPSMLLERLGLADTPSESRDCSSLDLYFRGQDQVRRCQTMREPKRVCRRR